MVIISKTDYILFRECPKNTWLKIHKPDVFFAAKLSEFEKSIIETGNEVELVAQKLFPGGDFQITFSANGFLAISDVVVLRSDGAYDLYEIKATTDVDKKTHYHDLAFQKNVIEMSGSKVARAFVIHLNSEYVRQGELELHKLFATTDVSEEVFARLDEVKLEMQKALTYLSDEHEPKGHCGCVYKGRSNHCATFAYSNPDVPEYGVHDLSRIGASKGKLQEMIDVGMFKLEDVSEDIFKKLTSVQQNQIVAYIKNAISIDRYNISKELSSLHFPLYFLDYETYPSAIPRFDGFSPYQQIPFQYSLYVLDSPGAELKHFEFLHDENTDPTVPLAASLKENLGTSGNIIVWNKKFECKINEEIAKRLPAEKGAMDAINARVYDLMDIFGKQYYVHKDFKGRISIKNVLPVLVPELSYKTLEIQEGGTASQKWNHAVTFASLPEKEKIVTDLKEYCKMDTHAMVAIWQHLTHIIS